MHRIRIEMIVELYPNAKPWIMFGAAPPEQDLATYFTGL